MISPWGSLRGTRESRGHEVQQGSGSHNPWGTGLRRDLLCSVDQLCDACRQEIFAFIGL